MPTIRVNTSSLLMVLVVMTCSPLAALAPVPAHAFGLQPLVLPSSSRPPQGVPSSVDDLLGRIDSRAEGDSVNVVARRPEVTNPAGDGPAGGVHSAPSDSSSGDTFLVQGPAVENVVHWWESDPLYMADNPLGAVLADCGELDGSGEAIWIECVPPVDPELEEPVDEDDESSEPAPVVVTAEDLARLPISAGELVIQPPMDDASERWVAVNVETIAYSRAEAQRFTPTLLGQQVEVEVWPVEYVWNFHDPVAEAQGEAAVYTTADPGAPYPDHTFAHTYTQAVDETGISLLTRWVGQFRGPGTGGWQPIAGSAVTVSASPAFEVREFTPRLVDPSTLGP